MSPLSFAQSLHPSLPTPSPRPAVSCSPSRGLSLSCLLVQFDCSSSVLGTLQQRLGDTLFSLFPWIFDLFAFCLFFYTIRNFNFALDIPTSKQVIFKFYLLLINSFVIYIDLNGNLRSSFLQKVFIEFIGVTLVNKII